MDSQRTVVSWGEFLWDLFPDGKCLGGAPANVAIHLANGGIPTTLITRLGKDTLGVEALATLSGIGLNPKGLQIDETLPTGKVDIEVHNHEARYTLHSGAWQKIACDADARESLRQCSVFYFGTLSQEQPSGLKSWRDALAQLQDQAIRICDPNLRGGRIDPQLTYEHMAAATIVKLNDGEARTFETTFRCKSAVRWLLDTMGVRLVALTHGASGATLYTHDGQAHHPGFIACHDGDNVGAGDAFSAVLIRACLRMIPIEKRLASTAVAANRYGSFVAGKRGATPIPSVSLLEEIDKLLEG